MKIFLSQKLLLVHCLYIPVINIEIIAFMGLYAKKESPPTCSLNWSKESSKSKLFQLTWKLTDAAEHQAGELFAACVAKETRN